MLRPRKGSIMEDPSESRIMAWNWNAIRRGAIVQRSGSYSDADAERLRTLMGTAFGSALHDDYVSRPVHRIYVADDYRGAAITTDTSVGSHYLSKFAVEQRARGEGIGHDLWLAVTSDYDELFWRSRPDNPISSWYATTATASCARASGTFSGTV